MAKIKDGNAGDSGDGPSLSEEEWAEFEKSFTKDSTKTAAYKEPSARQRELTEKWKKEKPKDTGWRTDSPKAVDTAHATPLIRKRRKPWVRNLVWFLVAAVVTAAIVGGPKLLSHKKDSDGTGSNVPFRPPILTPIASGTGGQSGTALASSPTASAAASPAATSRTYAYPDDQYFDGSPSIDWQNNAAGIVVPAAARIGNYTAKTVGDAYDALRQMLITADLDPEVWAGAEPTEVFKLLDPREQVQQDYESWAANPTRQKNPKILASRFNPKTTKVLGSTVKVHGAMSAALDGNGDLIVSADYSFVYALSPVDHQSLDRSLVRRVWKLEIQPTSAGRGTYWLSSWWYDIFNDKCTVIDGFINPSFNTDGGANTGKILDPYASTPPPAAQTQPSGVASSSPAPSTDCNGSKPV